MTDTAWTITSAAAALRAGTLTSVDLLRQVTEIADRLDGEIGTYVCRFDDTAMAAAVAADEAFAAGKDLGPLQGIPIGIKDIIATKEGPTTNQSVVHDPEWWAGEDAPVVARLRAAGAVITGKATTMEYACGLPDPDKPFPIPRNSWSLDHYPGGSSSGSGSGVAAGMFLGALGTDTGGSVRLPASYSGISGLKQTYGLVPKNGCFPLGVSLDHIGPMARSAADCAVMLAVMAGYDPGDSCAIPGVEVPDYPAMLTGTLEGLTVGVDWSVHRTHGGTDPELDPAFVAAVEVLRAAGARVVDVTLPLFPELTAATMSTWPAEAFTVHKDDLVNRWTDYGRSARSVIGSAALMTASDYVQAQKVRALGRAALAEMFADVDLVVTPTTATGAIANDELTWPKLIGSLFTPYWNAVGNPALSVPMGFTDGGLPMGLQIAGRPLEDGVVLRAGDAYQRATDFHLQVPPIVASVGVAA